MNLDYQLSRQEAANPGRGEGAKPGKHYNPSRSEINLGRVKTQYKPGESEGKVANCIGFKAVERSDARVLILGTLPGIASLRQRQYYARKQNSFWKIMGKLLGAAPELPYEDRLERLTERGVALWDVCAAAEREGSLDADIQSPVPNDFASFFKAHRDIRLICFNGQPAEKLFRRHVMPGMPESVLSLPCRTLPSTSPAHAAMGFEQKLSCWHEALGKFIVCDGQ